MRRALSIVLLAVTLSFPTAALAAEAEKPQMEVQVWAGAEPGQVLVIVSTTVPPDVKLPAVVRLPLVKGMSVTWAGEIAPAGQADDIQREPVTKEGTGGSYVEFRAEKYRDVQVELSGLALTSDGARFSTSVDYVQTTPAGLTGFSVRLPSGASEAQVSPTPVGQPARNESGDILYTLPSAQLKPGDKNTITFSYGLGGAGQPGSTTEGGASTGSVIGVLLLGLAIAVVVLVMVLGKQRRATSE